MESIRELIEKLNATDECSNIEAKRGGSIHKAVMESVCSLSNEPGLGGGFILLGVERDEATLFPEYTVTGISNPDKLQLDLVTQCASMFNQRIRPEVEIEKLDTGKIVMKVFVTELPVAQKPLLLTSTLPIMFLGRLSKQQMQQKNYLFKEAEGISKDVRQDRYSFIYSLQRIYLSPGANDC